MRHPSRSGIKRRRPAQASRRHAKGMPILGVTVPTSAAKSTTADSPASSLRHWKLRLVHRKYVDLVNPGGPRQFSARIESNGTSAYFLLGSDNETRAAKRALEIHRTLKAEGWRVTSKRYPREFTLAIFWWGNPLLCTYTTLLTARRRKPGGSIASANATGKLIRVAVIESDEQVRSALAAWTSLLPGCRCAGAFADPAQVRLEITSENTDLLLFNRSLTDGHPGPPGVDAGSPAAGPPSFAFGIYETSDDIFISHTGVSQGYYLRRTPPPNVLDPLKSAWDEASPDAASVLLTTRKYFQSLIGNPPGRDDSHERTKLTPREEEILLRLSKGYPDKQIANTLSISTWTVHNHMKNIFRKLGVHTRTQAVIKYLQK